MCTAMNYTFGDHYFGRNLDLEYGYAEQVVITPRCFPFPYRNLNSQTGHYAMIGMATVAENYPLYYEATNERGLSMAGLNFPGHGCYLPELPGRANIAAFEFIPWILSQCASLEEARKLLAKTHLVNIPFSDDFPPQPLHWIISDRYASLVVEPMADGIHIHENPAGVLANNPPFEYHMYRLAEFQNLSIDKPRYHNAITNVPVYSGGMGAIGLPGDFSSASRFIRAAFLSHNSVSNGLEDGNVTQFFRMLQAVAMPRGCVRANFKDFVTTRYSCCCNTDRGIYYYTTYDNTRITAIELRKHDLFSDRLTAYPLRLDSDFAWET